MFAKDDQGTDGKSDFILERTTEPRGHFDGLVTFGCALVLMVGAVR